MSEATSQAEQKDVSVPEDEGAGEEPIDHAQIATNLRDNVGNAAFSLAPHLREALTAWINSVEARLSKTE